MLYPDANASNYEKLWPNIIGAMEGQTSAPFKTKSMAGCCLIAYVALTVACSQQFFRVDLPLVVAAFFHRNAIEKGLAECTPELKIGWPYTGPQPDCAVAVSYIFIALDS